MSRLRLRFDAFQQTLLIINDFTTKSTYLPEPKPSYIKWTIEIKCNLNLGWHCAPQKSSPSKEESI